MKKIVTVLVLLVGLVASCFAAPISVKNKYGGRTLFAHNEKFETSDKYITLDDWLGLCSKDVHVVDDNGIWYYYYDYDVIYAAYLDELTEDFEVFPEVMDYLGVISVYSVNSCNYSIQVVICDDEKLVCLRLYTETGYY